MTHNGKKLNYVLPDCDTGKFLCVMDPDTIMSGLYDWGISARCGCGGEKDLSKPEPDLNMFEIYTRGFLKEAPR